jgi:hypothetical protein
VKFCILLIKGGCIVGAASLTHGQKDKKEVDKYGSLALEKKLLMSPLG